MDYGYVNARIKGMKSRLLSAHDLNDLTAKPDIDALIGALESTAYRDELLKAGIEYSGVAQIEVALRRDLIRSLRKVFSFFREESEEVYIRLILNRWDVQNVKTLLRGKKIHAPPDEVIDCLLPAGELDEAALIELTQQPDVRAIIDLLATWRIEYARPLTRHLQEYFETRDLSVLEFALDRFYYEHALSILKNNGVYDAQIVREMIATEIDVANIRTVLRIIRDRMQIEDAGEYLIAGGRDLGIEELSSLVLLGTIEEAIKQIRGTPYEFLAEIPEKCIAAEKISALERELERFLVQKGCGNFLKDPLSIAIPVAFIWAKQNEVTNIRIIARSIIGDVSEAELRKALTYV